MAATQTLKLTFTLDDNTVRRLETAADRLALPKSEIVREAIAEFYDRLGQLSEKEKTAMLRAFDELVPKIEARAETDVDRELADVWRARKRGGRRSSSERMTNDDPRHVGPHR